MGKISYMTPVVTAFHEDGSLDAQGCRNVYEHLIKGGVDGIVVMGSTGEFFSMPMAQKKELIDVAVESVNHCTRLLIGTSCMEARETVELANYAHEKGADGVMVIPPYYFALSDESVEAYFDIVAEGTAADIFLYNFPDRTGYDITPAVALRLARKHKNIVGYKDTVVGMAHTRELIKAMRPEFPEFEILSGFDDNFVHNVLSGGNGSIGGLSNLAPELTSALCKAVRNKNVDDVVKYQRVIDQLMDLYGVGVPFIPYLKRAMKMRGIQLGETCTVPFLPATAEQAARLEEIMKRTNLL